MEYKVFTSDVVSIGDLYFSPVGGFTIQACVVHRVDKKGFAYRNSRYSAYQSFNENLDGMLVKADISYLAANVLEEILGLGK